MAKAADIKAEAEKTRKDIIALNNKIHDEVSAIEFAAFKANRDPTPAEQKRQDELEATKKELQKQITILGFVTASKLDKSDDVSRLLERMESVNAGLADRLARLKKIEKFAKVAAQVADALAKVAERLAKIVASGAI
jgi:hypothetical protein